MLEEEDEFELKERLERHKVEDLDEKEKIAKSFDPMHVEE